MNKTRNFAEVIRARLVTEPDLAQAVEAEYFNADVATKVYEARRAAGLTQRQLAELTDTHQSVISRIEDADYNGHSLTLLTRIGKALGLQLRVEFCASPISGTVCESYPVEWPPAWPVDIRMEESAC